MRSWWHSSGCILRPECTSSATEQEFAPHRSHGVSNTCMRCTMHALGAVLACMCCYVHSSGAVLVMEPIALLERYSPFFCAGHMC
jgi:hypothetical protein